MGLYDTIRCERPLPDGFKGQLQTKDLGCSMVEHIITEDGRLLIANGFLHQEGIAEAPDFEGVVNFYGGEYFTEDGQPYRGRGGVLHQGGKCLGPNGELLRYQPHEYNATFEKGRLIEIQIVPEI